MTQIRLIFPDSNLKVPDIKSKVVHPYSNNYTLTQGLNSAFNDFSSNILKAIIYNALYLRQFSGTIENCIKRVKTMQGYAMYIV